MAAKRSTAKKSGSSKAKAKVGKVMREFKHGQLKSGGRKKVTNPKQAVAIGLSEARRAGAKVAPKRKSSSKKTAAKKTAAKKSPARKRAAKKSTAKKRSRR